MSTPMIRTDDELRAAERVVKQLEKKFKAGEATPQEIERMKAGQDHILIYGWYKEWQDIKSNPPTPERRYEKTARMAARPAGGIIANLGGGGDVRARLAPRLADER